MKDHTAQLGSALTADDALSRYAAYERQKAASIPINKAVLFPALLAAGVTTVVVSFDGYGDSGQIEGVEARAGDDILQLPDRSIEFAHADWNANEPQDRSVSLQEGVEALAWDVLTSTHGGWENNDGGFGEVVFDVKAGEIRLDFNLRFSDSEFHRHTF
jgi:hypothetical protein